MSNYFHRKFMKWAVKSQKYWRHTTVTGLSRLNILSELSNIPDPAYHRCENVWTSWAILDVSQQQYNPHDRIFHTTSSAAMRLTTAVDVNVSNVPAVRATIGKTRSFSSVYGPRSPLHQLAGCSSTTVLAGSWQPSIVAMNQDLVLVSSKIFVASARTYTSLTSTFAAAQTFVDAARIWRADPEKVVVGFIGLGNMGEAMASNLLARGFPLLVHDRSEKAMKVLERKGAVPMASAGEMATQADVIISMLPSSQSVLEVYLGPSGVFANCHVQCGAKAEEDDGCERSTKGNKEEGGVQEQTRTRRPWLFIDSSTVDPSTSKKISAAAMSLQKKSNTASTPFRPSGNGEEVARREWEGGSKGERAVELSSSSSSSCSPPPPPWHVIDAPVSGGVHGAHNATLTFMVGGAEEAYESAQPLLLAMGARAIHCGPSGAGSAAKLCNNLALAVEMAGVAEALSLGQRLGLSPTLLSSIFNSSSAKCWSSETYNPAPGVMENVPSSRDYKGGFSNALMLKDLGLALQAAEKVCASIPLARNVTKMYEHMCEEGNALDDFSSIFKHSYGGLPSSD